MKIYGTRTPFFIFYMYRLIRKVINLRKKNQCGGSASDLDITGYEDPDSGSRDAKINTQKRRNYILTS